MLKFSGLVGLSSCFERKSMATDAFKFLVCRQATHTPSKAFTRPHVGDIQTSYTLHVSAASQDHASDT